MALIVIVLASWFLYRYLAPKTWREWAGVGVIQAFIIALYPHGGSNDASQTDVKTPGVERAL